MRACILDCTACVYISPYSTLIESLAAQIAMQKQWVCMQCATVVVCVLHLEAHKDTHQSIVC